MGLGDPFNQAQTEPAAVNLLVDGAAYFVTDGEPIEFRDFITRLLATQGVQAQTLMNALRRDGYDVTIAEEGGKLVMRFSHTPLLVGNLEHWQHDTFVARWRDRELRADLLELVQREVQERRSGRIARLLRQSQRVTFAE